LLGVDTGLTPLAALDPAGMRTVLELRSRYARPAKPLTSPELYLDLRYYERARNPGAR
jgi:hypothetical protein